MPVEAGVLIDHMPFGLIVLDDRACVKLLNPAAEELFGFAAAEIMGSEIMPLIPDLHRHIQEHLLMPKQYGYFEQNKSNSRSSRNLFIHRELAGIHKNGSRLALSVSISEADNGGKRIFKCFIQNIAGQKQIAEELRRLSIITDRIPSSVIITNREGKIVFANPSFLKTSGYSLEEIIGSTPRILKSGVHPPKFYQQLWQTVLSGHEWTGEFCNKKKDGTLIHELQTIFPMKDAEGRITQFISVKIDDTERNRAEKRIKRYVDKLEKVNEELSNFTSVASHDLQEPLRKIITLGDRLESRSQHALDRLGKDYLARIQKCSMRMQELIQGLLDYGTITARPRKFKRVDLNVIVAEVIRSLDAKIKSTKAVVEVSKLPVIEACRLQIRRLFQNLLSNALKFRRAGVPPAIKIGATGFIDGYEEITVEDNGIGFEMKYLNTIFKPFRRLHAKDEYSGSGIGLAVCQKIVLRHGGTITAKSAPGEGAKFCVLLPGRQKIESKMDMKAIADDFGGEVSWEKSLIDHSPVSMMFADSNLILKHMNPVALQTLKPMEQHLGRSLQSLIGTSLLSFHKNPRMVLRVLSDARNLPYTLQVQVGPQFLEFTTNSIYDDRRNLAGYVAVWQVLKTYDNGGVRMLNENDFAPGN